VTAAGEIIFYCTYTYAYVEALGFRVVTE